jgi:predicted nucleic acid-binding protein
MSEGGIVVADSGPLIALSRIGQLELLPQLFGRVQIPSAVWREVTQGAGEGRSGAAEVRAAPWIDVVSADEASVAGYALIVDEGEAAAIVVAKACDALLIIDDDRGRRLALRLGLRIKGTLGILVLAKRRGLLARVRPLIDALPRCGVYVSQRLIDAVLHDVNE